VDIVVVVQFRNDKLACERIYWDHAAVLRQVGLLQAGRMLLITIQRPGGITWTREEL
jgi:carboxymethylenebutenolidase